MLEKSTDPIIKMWQKQIKKNARSEDYLDCGYGVNLLEGNPSPENNRKIMAMMEQAALSGSPVWQNNFGHAWLHGRYCNVDEEKGFFWIKTAAENGNREALCTMGDFYEKGQLVPRDYQKAVAYYAASAKRNCVPAWGSLGYCYLFGWGVEKSKREARLWLEKASVYGYESSRWLLVTLELSVQERRDDPFYEQGRLKLLEEDREGGIELFEEGASRGLPKSQYALVWLDYKERGAQSDADDWWPILLPFIEELAAAGDESAETILYFYHKNGFAGLSDKQKGYAYCKHAAEGGYYLAQINLAHDYLTGPLPYDYKQGEYWYEKAAEHFPILQFKVGSSYHEGANGLKKDERKALFWITKAAENGYVHAQHVLGLMHESGLVAPKDLEKAEFWYKTAAENGHQDAQESLDKLNQLKNLPVFNQEILFKKIQNKLTSERLEDMKETVENMEALGKENVGYFTMFSSHYSNLLYKTANMMFDSANTPEEQEEAFKWMERAKAQGAPQAYLSLGLMYYYGKGTVQNYGQAVKHFRLCIDKAEDKGEAYFYLGNCYARGLFFEKDVRRAQEFYKLALEYGFDCYTAIDALQYEQESSDRPLSSIRYYAEDLVKNGNSATWGALIQQDLKKEFGECWNKFKETTKTNLITGITVYTMFMSFGEAAAKANDFSPAIMSLTKALEIELAQYFFTGYIEYLKGKGVDPLQVYGLRKYVVHKNGGGEYPSSDQTQMFSLGALRPIFEINKDNKDSELVAVGANTCSISSHVVDYAEQLFRSDVCDGADRRQKIARYLIEFSNETLTLAEYRNFAAHARVMSCSDAELCADCLLHVKKLMYKFISKIK